MPDLDEKHPFGPDEPADSPIDIDPGYVTMYPPVLPRQGKYLLLVYYVAMMVAIVIILTFIHLLQQWWWLIFFLPLELLGVVFAFTFTSVGLIKIAVMVLEKACPPREGIFPRDGRDMRYYQVRAQLKYFALWLARNSTFPWIDTVVYSIFGVPVGKTVVLHEAWVDTELVSIGDYCMIGMGSSVIAHGLYHEAFLARKVTIEDNCIVGAYSIISPGVVMEFGSVTAANSISRIDQVIPPRSMMVGDGKVIPPKEGGPSDGEKKAGKGGSG